MSAYTGPVFDADNHYYEALDAFTRHLDPRLGPRCVQWCDIDGRKYQVVGGRVSRVVTNPTFDPIAKAGAMHDYFRGNPDGRNPLEFLREREPIRPEYRDRDARVQVIHEQGLEGSWMFPTLGMLYEQLLLPDVEAFTLTFTAFNRWLAEDWGFAYENTIYAAPYFSLADPAWAVRELEWAIHQGARLIVMRPAAQFTADGPRTPGHPDFDPFWARVQEAGLTVVVHAGDSGYDGNGYFDSSFTANFSGGNMGPSIKMLQFERAVFDFLASLIFDRFFIRFPGIRLASVENGAEFLPDLFRKLRSQHHRIPGFFPEDPVETLRRNVWINPFWEDDPYEITEMMGADRVLFGSDWPHIEGMPNPRDYEVEIKELDAESQGKILHDNAIELTARAPHS